MNVRHSLTALCSACLLASCSSTPSRASHPTVAVMDLQQPKRHWYQFGFGSTKHHLIARSLDGKPVLDQSLPGGMVIPPGPHTVTLGSRNVSGADLGGRFGAVGEKLGQKMNAMRGKHDRDLNINAIPGHDYTAQMRPHRDGFQYWIEDATNDQIVADTRK